jgi:hypothetical protein
LFRLSPRGFLEGDVDAGGGEGEGSAFEEVFDGDELEAGEGLLTDGVLVEAGFGDDESPRFRGDRPGVCPCMLTKLGVETREKQETLGDGNGRGCVCPQSGRLIGR